MENFAFEASWKAKKVSYPNTAKSKMVASLVSA